MKTSIKYVLAGVCVLAASAVAFLAAREGPKPPKYYAIEPETKVRPARFEDMKWHPQAELRQPASVKNKKHKR